MNVSLRTAAGLGLNALHECIVPKGAETQISDAMRALRSAIDADLSATQPDGFQARYRIPDGEWSSWGHVVCGVKGHEQELRIAPDRASPSRALPVAWAATDEDGNVEALGMNQSRRFDTPLYTRAQPLAAPLPAAVDVGAAQAETALRQVLSVVQRYLPPGGPSAQDAIAEIIAVVDPWPLGRLEKKS